MAVFDLDRLIPFGTYADGTPATHDFDALGALKVQAVNPPARSSAVFTIVNGARVRGYEAFYLGPWTRVNNVPHLVANGVQASVFFEEMAEMADSMVDILVARRTQFALEGWNSFRDAPEEMRPRPIVYAVDEWSNIAGTLHSNDPATLRENELRKRATEASVELYRFGAPYRIHTVISQDSDPSGDPSGACLSLTKPGFADYQDGRGFMAEVALWKRD